MDQEELMRHLEFECHAHNAALKSDAEQHGLPYEPLTFEEFARRRGVDDSLDRPRLKPCPFCLGTPRLADNTTQFDWLNPEHRHYQVVCKCGVGGPRFYQHRHFAVQGWNKMCRQDNVTLVSIEEAP